MPSAALSISSVTLATFLAGSLTHTDVPATTRVTGGSRAKPCAWPAVMLMGTHAPGTKQETGCTGTLVHPELILYAAHCGTPYVIIMDEHRKGKRVLKKKDFLKAGRHPRWKNDSMTHVDWAYVRLREPITDIPTTPVVAGCERDVLQKTGKPVIFAGFSKNNAQAMDAIVLRWAQAKISAIGGGKIRAGANGITACPGDSGGPMLAKLSDGSWRTVGIASTISNLKGCGKAGTYNTYAQINRALIEWVESDSGIDITPCFDLDGRPTPSAQCDAFRAYSGDPKSPQGKRENSCVEALTKRAGDFCEVPKKEQPENEESTTGTSESESTSSTEEGDSTDLDTTGSEDASSSSDTSDTEPESSEQDDTDSQGENEDEDQDEEESPDIEDEQEQSPEEEESDAPAKAKPKRPEKGGCALQTTPPLGLFALFSLQLLHLRNEKSRLRSGN